MARSNPGVGPLKPHIRKVKAMGTWHVWYRDGRGAYYSGVEVSWMTANSAAAKEAKVWCAQRNARIVASRGPWNCRSVLPNG